MRHEAVRGEKVFYSIHQGSPLRGMTHCAYWMILVRYTRTPLMLIQDHWLHSDRAILSHRNPTDGHPAGCVAIAALRRVSSVQHRSEQAGSDLASMAPLGVRTVARTEE